MVEQRQPACIPGTQKQLAWRSVSAAILARAAGQLVRHAAALSPQSSVDANTSGVLGTSFDMHVDEPDTNGDELPAPEEDTDDKDEDLYDTVEALPPQGDPAEAEPKAAATKPIRLLVRLPSGAHLPVSTSCEAVVADLKAGVLAQCGLPPEMAPKLGLALGHAGLDEQRTVIGNDLSDGDVVLLFERR